MPSFIVPNGAQVRIRWGFSGAPGMNVIGATGSGTGTITQATADSLDSAIKAAWASSGYQALCPGSTTLDYVGIRATNDATNAEFIGSGAPEAGDSIGSDALPRGASVVVTMRTAKAGKSYRGRVYLGGWDESANAAGAAIASGALTAANAFITAIGTALAAQGMQLAVLSNTVHLATPVTSHLVRNAGWGSQRNRNVRP